MAASVNLIYRLRFIHLWPFFQLNILFTTNLAITILHKILRKISTHVLQIAYKKSRPTKQIASWNSLLRASRRIGQFRSSFILWNWRPTAKNGSWILNTSVIDPPTRSRTFINKSSCSCYLLLWSRNRKLLSKGKIFGCM